MAVSQNGSPNMSVNVATGVVMMAGSEGATQASYVAVAPSITNVVITAANATLPRIDLIVVNVRDSAYSGANNDWQMQAIAGTPNASPVAPAAPANSVILAQVLVGANVTTITNANITDVRPYSAYGIILCRSTADYPTVALEGMVVYNATDNNLSVYDGAVWSSAKGAQFLQRVIVTVTGSFTKASFPGLKKVRVCCQGGGGAGGGTGTTAAATTTGSGGGQGGAYAESWVDASAMAASVTVTVGTGGAALSGGAGGNGNSTSFGSTVIAPGGTGATGSGVGANTSFGLAGGTGAQVMTGDFQVSGGAGQWGARLGNGTTAVAGQAVAGIGGSSYFGNGGEGGNATGGGDGRGFGGGGGGVTSNPSSATRAGGNGAPGVVVLDLYV
jgi:hypothetical protein